MVSTITSILVPLPPSLFTSYFIAVIRLTTILHHLQWEVATEHGFLNYGTISKNFVRPDFYIFSLVFLSRECELGTTSVAKSRPSVLYKANLLFSTVSLFFHFFGIV